MLPDVHRSLLQILQSFGLSHGQARVPYWAGVFQDWTNMERKGKEEYLYSSFIQRLVSTSSDMDHTVLPANYTMPAFLS